MMGRKKMLTMRNDRLMSGVPLGHVILISKKIGKFVANLRVGCSVSLAMSMNLVSFALEATCSLMLLV